MINATLRGKSRITDRSQNLSTRDHIIEVAVDLFSQKGFSAVSIREITKGVGIRGSSLYNHFKSKDEILETIFDYLVNELAKTNPPEEDIDDLISTHSLKDLLQIHAELFKDRMKDPKIEKIWRILTIEQYNNDKIRAFVTKELIDKPIAYFETLFRKMQKQNLIYKYDPKLLAIEYVSFSIYIYFRYVILQPNLPLNLAEFDEIGNKHINFISEILKSQTRTT